MICEVSDVDVLDRSCMSLFDCYVSVGEVKKSPVMVDGCVFIEVWLTFTFSSKSARAECISSQRRPIYRVVEQIEELVGTQDACILFQCDDRRDDTVGWGAALALILYHLKDVVKYSVMFTVRSEEQLEEVKQPNYFPRPRDGLLMQYFLENVGVLVMQQENYYVDKAPLQMKTRCEKTALLLQKFMRAIRQ